MVDGVVWQAEAAAPKGLSRVWLSLLPLPAPRTIGPLAVYATLAVEGSIPVLLSFRRTRTLGVMVAVAMHVVFGLAGYYGFSATMETFTAKMGIPGVLALAAIAAEFLGAIALIVGIGGRVAVFGIGVTMIVAATMHAGNGFFMNWYGQQAGEGFEYHLLAIGLAAALVVRGSGAFSLDRLLAPRLAAAKVTS